MRLLITGGSGFVGLALAQAARESGWTVGLFAQTAPPPALGMLAGGDELDLILGDVRSEDDVARAIAAFEPTHIVHGAAMTPAPDKEFDVAATLLAVNVAGTAVVVRAAAQAAVQRLVVLSSNGVYGVDDPADGPLDEAHALHPENLYGISKVAAEQAARRLATLAGLDLVVARLGSLYGPFEYESGVRPIMSPHLQMLRAAHAGRPVTLAWPMRNDWIYARDAAAGILAACTGPGLGGGTFNIGSGDRSDLLGWGDRLAAHFPGWRFALAEPGASADIVYRMASERPSLAVERFAAATGFRARYDQARAADDFVAWFDDYARLSAGG